MLVPLMAAYRPPMYVDIIHTPGAAISTSGPKLLNQANVSSGEGKPDPVQLQV